MRVDGRGMTADELVESIESRSHELWVDIIESSEELLPPGVANFASMLDAVDEHAEALCVHPAVASTYRWQLREDLSTLLRRIGDDVSQLPGVVLAQCEVIESIEVRALATCWAMVHAGTLRDQLAFEALRAAVNAHAPALEGHTVIATYYAQELRYLASGGGEQ